MKVFLSPSTQEANNGLNGYNEEIEMNKITDLMIPLLDVNGIQWQRNDPKRSRFDAVAKSNYFKADVHLAIHSDAGGGKGTTAFTSGTANSRRLTTCIYTRVASLTPSADRGIKLSTDLTEIIKPKAYSCLIEIAFHDLLEDVNFIINNRYSIAKALVQGLCDYFGITFKEEENFIYRVQVGAYKVKENADKTLQALADAGFTGFIKKEIVK